MARGLQKVQSQLKNAGNTAKTAEERAADRKKSEAAATGQVCLLCRQTFSNVAKEPMLRAHWESKHPKETDITKAFPQLKDCGAAGAATAAAVPAKKEKAAGLQPGMSVLDKVPRGSRSEAHEDPLNLHRISRVRVLHFIC